MSIESILSEMPGLHAAKAVVSRIAREEVGVHAILLYGPAGIGKARLARLLTESWIRKTPEPEECSAVNAFRRGASADVVVVRPWGASNIIKLAAISREAELDKDYDIPDLQSFFRTGPLMSRRKVAIIEDCHRFNSRAANAFLKTLEEPHPYVKIVMTTPEIGSVLATIRSRCLCVACEAPSAPDLLASFPDLTEDERRFSDGAPITLQKVRASTELYDRLARFARSLRSRRAPDVLVVAEEFRALCDAFGKADESNARGSQTTAIHALALYLAGEPGTPPAWIRELAEAHRRIQGNVNASLVFDAMFARMLTR